MYKVINFHDIKSINWFKQTLNILKNKFNLVDIKEIENFYYNGKILKNSCHLTIDDGDKTFYDIIYPVLKKMNIPATLFVSPKICADLSNFWFQEIRVMDPDKMKKIISEDYKIDLNILQPYSIFVIFKNLKISQIWSLIGRYKSLHNLLPIENQNMSIEQLKEIDRYGLITIGAHTMNHPILANESDETSEQEIVDSIRGLENILAHEVNYFAYPNGTPNLDFSLREIEILKNTNCSLAFSVEKKDFKLTDNPFSIPRYGLTTGSKYFIKAKILLGKNWDLIKNMRSKDEVSLRLELKKKINFN
jgi:peptidoglycan/xylan/chitin deacetylase (PgdA/CDA1 family)